MVAAYIILGIAAIGREIENPFGHDVNDLDMDGYVNQLANDLIIMTSSPPPNMNDVFETTRNLPLWPYSLAGFSILREKPIEEIRQATLGRVERQHVSVGADRDRLNRERVESFGSSRMTVVAV